MPEAVQGAVNPRPQAEVPNPEEGRARGTQSWRPSASPRPPSHLSAPELQSGLFGIPQISLEACRDSLSAVIFRNLILREPWELSSLKSMHLIPLHVEAVTLNSCRALGTSWIHVPYGSSCACPEAHWACVACKLRGTRSRNPQVPGQSKFARLRGFMAPGQCI